MPLTASRAQSARCCCQLGYRNLTVPTTTRTTEGNWRATPRRTAVWVVWPVALSGRGAATRSPRGGQDDGQEQSAEAPASWAPAAEAAHAVSDRQPMPKEIPT